MLFPIGDGNSRRRTRPVVVPVLLATNIGVWLLQLLYGDAITYGWSAVPYEIMTSTDLVGVATVPVDGGMIVSAHRARVAP